MSSDYVKIKRTKREKEALNLFYYRQAVKGAAKLLGFDQKTESGATIHGNENELCMLIERKYFDKFPVNENDVLCEEDEEFYKKPEIKNGIVYFNDGSYVEEDMMYIDHELAEITIEGRLDHNTSEQIPQGYLFGIIDPKRGKRTQTDVRIRISNDVDMKSGKIIFTKLSYAYDFTGYTVKICTRKD